MDNIKAVIFDLDGTLLDTEYYQWQGWVVPLKEIFNIDLSKEEYLKYAGKRGDQIEKELKEDYKLDFEEGFLLGKKEPLLEKWFKEEKVKEMPFARGAVEFFYNNPNYSIALCSGGPREEVLIKLEKNDFLKYFTIIVAGTDVERGKPFPDIYEKTINMLSLEPGECLALEDTQYGLEAAKSAGAKCFVVPSEYSMTQDFSIADKKLETLEDITKIFDK